MTLPDLDPAVLTLVDQAERLLVGRRIAVLTGAGVSTDSGIPDYRGVGAPVRSPMTFQVFLADQRARQRYWAGSHLGWRYFAAAGPNAGHLALAELELADIVNGVITQNVDGLHLRAGSRHVVDVHGSMDRVFCLSCGQQFAREDIAARMTRENPWLAEPDTVKLNPDGDVDIDAVGEMVVPSCTVCDGILKPDVVFFGELVPTTKFTAGAALIRAADAFIVAGSSLVVNSGIRLLEQAVRRRVPIVIVNRGETKGDSRATLKIDAGTSEVLGALKERLAS
ncbi:Sir2 family NAD-dependent protein deacetylase [Pseudolysinimonas sp.]|uniref:Sir2 family NAD-dependent protein deacetylase n=1 Tax=Pseudolysinimonas sp. TaxID=2680009 RepID=UPI00286B6B04|nr:Sir2 family NAD-dependent protein deacetylase [Pseudolysinimonas sp.]